MRPLNSVRENPYAASADTATVSTVTIAATKKLFSAHVGIVPWLKILP